MSPDWFKSVSQRITFYLSWLFRKPEAAAECRAALSLHPPYSDVSKDTTEPFRAEIGRENAVIQILAMRGTWWRYRQSYC